MNPVHELLDQLTSRLPELEWKISKLSSVIFNKNLPKGLFRSGTELTGASCVKEIKADIHALSQQANDPAANFLAERIKQKINVLVTLCQIDSRKNKSEEKISFGLAMLSTRQQWIQGLENDINTLTIQKKAMLSTLENMKSIINSPAILSLQAELGEIERRLTLASETLQQAIS